MLQRLSILLNAEYRRVASELGLQDVHVQILSFLQQANRYSNTLAAVTEYLGSTKGTASQSISLLEKKGLLTRMPDAQDKRVSRLLLTPEGITMLESIVGDNVVHQSLDHINGRGDKQVRLLLSDLLRTCQLTHGRKAFGICAACRHHQIAADGSRRCGLTSEALSEDDSALICREYDAAE